MAQLNVKLAEQQLDGLRRYAARRRTPVSWLIKDYVDYLLAGGRPVRVDGDLPTTTELTAVVQQGGSFDWLADEPDLYSANDGEPV